MKIAIYGQFYHDNSGIYVQTLLDVLIEKNIEVVIEKGFYEIIASKISVQKQYAVFTVM